MASAANTYSPSVPPGAVPAESTYRVESELGRVPDDQRGGDGLSPPGAVSVDQREAAALLAAAPSPEKRADTYQAPNTARERHHAASR